MSDAQEKPRCPRCTSTSKNAYQFECWPNETTPDPWHDAPAALSREAKRIADLEEALCKVEKWCTGEWQVEDGEDAEDALRYIQLVVKAALLPEREG